MIIGIGSDIVSIARIAGVWRSQGQRFLDRCFTEYEQNLAAGIKNEQQKTAYYAKRWAAKEALAKACGTGIGATVGFQDIEVVRDQETGRPGLHLTGNAATYIEKLCAGGVPVLHLSLSDEKDIALAFVVLSTLAEEQKQ